MIIFFKVVFGILLLVFFLLFSPLHILIKYEETVQVKFRLLFLFYQLIPKKKQKKQEKEDKNPIQKQPEKGKKSKIQDILDKRGLSGFLELIQNAVNIMTGAAKKIFPHFVIDVLNLSIWNSDEDAAQAAVQYGYVCGVVCTAMGLLLNQTECKRYSIQIIPDFDSSISRVQFSLDAHIKLVYLLAALFKSVRGFAILQKELR